MIGFAIQVARWTPFVTAPIGTSSCDRPGHNGCQISRDTCPCRSDTPLTRLDVRIARTVI